MAETVAAAIKGDGVKKLVKVTIDTDGDRGSETAEITATDGHPFWAPELGEWIDATDLRSGQWLRTGSGTYVQITAIDRWDVLQATVHNLTVANIHTYYVVAGNTPVLVHNCNDVITNAEGCDNSGAVGAHGDGTGFSGVYDLDAGTFRAQRSVLERSLGDSPNVVLRNGGHGRINFEHCNMSRRTVGFTMIAEEGGFSIKWGSGLNGRNFGQRNAPEQYRFQVMEAVSAAVGRRVWSK